MTMSRHDWRGWRALKRRQRAQRALERQLAYQQEKAKALQGHEREFILTMMQSAQRVRALLESVRPTGQAARVLEVGSGAHGLIFCFGDERHSVGVDPLASHYARLFPAWQSWVTTIVAAGEALPFAADSFELVLCDNVVDHAENPARIMAEMARVLTPAGLLYFTVNTHHPVYALAARAHAAWHDLGVPYELDPFADHTVHLTLADARRLFAGLPLRILHETHAVAEAKNIARLDGPRHLGDRLKRVFFKNALYEVIALKEH